MATLLSRHRNAPPLSSPLVTGASSPLSHPSLSQRHSPLLDSFHGPLFRCSQRACSLLSRTLSSPFSLRSSRTQKLYRELMDLERREIIGDLLQMNPSYKAPLDYKPLLKETGIPTKEYSGQMDCLERAYLNLRYLKAQYNSVKSILKDFP